MMEIAAGIKGVAAAVVAVGAIGGGALTLDSRHAPISIVGEIGVMQIFDLVKMAQDDGRQDWICRAIDKELIKLCSDNPDHYLCRDREAVKDIKRKAGCE